VFRPVLVLASLLAAGALIASCGGGGDTTTIVKTESGGSESTATVTETTAPQQSGPSGELATDGVGAAKQGMSTEEVRALFGPPDSTRRLPGCELAGSQRMPVVSWTWDPDGGSLTLEFDAPTGPLTSYRSTTGELETAEGITVGDDFAALRSAYGDSLKPLNLGSARDTARSGIWYVRDNVRQQILFSIAAGRIGMIQGGDVSICE
jgi:hypothetical protein